MEFKRYLKLFNNQSDYESQKDEVMGIPKNWTVQDYQG